MRRTLALGSAVLIVGLMAAVLSAQQPAPAGQGRQAGPGRGGRGFSFGTPGTIQKVAENLYMIPGAGGNTSVLVTAKGVVLVDTKTPNNGQAIVDQVKTVTDKPIIYIINTHVHFDHTGSNAFFPEAVTIVAHENLAAALAKDPNFQAPEAKRGLVDQTYKDRLTLLSGDDAVDLYHFGRAHTNGDTVVVFRKARAMATGDVFAGKGQPLIDITNGGSGIAYPDFIRSMTTTIKNVDIVIPGHSALLKWQDLVDFGEFNRLFLEHARASLKAGKSAEEAMKEFKLPEKFQGYTLGPTMLANTPAGNFATIYKELQAQ